MAKSEYVKRRLAELGVVPTEKPWTPPSGVAKVRAHHDDMIPLTAYEDVKRYIKMKRRGSWREANWFDVRDAYLAGFRVGYFEGRQPDSGSSAL